jgi:DNA-binding NarL/FixJ family response regulator
MTRILIADDHALYRAGLRQFVAQSLPSAEIVEASTGNETLTSLQQKPCDLLFLDINMPDRSGLDILRHVRVSHAETACSY